MKLEVGMYVRTKYGITQYREYETDKGKLLCMPLTNGTFANIEDVVKASNNIIDLIEVGDYVNGYKVLEIFTGNFEPNNPRNVKALKLEFIKEDINPNIPFFKRYNFITNSEIKTIVTKEQFESMAYEVE